MNNYNFIMNIFYYKMINIKKNNINVFSDFDDTITTNSCLLYSKYKFLTNSKKLSHNKAYTLLKKDIKINPTFLKIIKKNNIKELSVLSYNNKKIIQQIIKDFNIIFSQNSVKINHIYWNINKLEKQKIIPNNSTYIADIFEYRIFNQIKKRKNIHFICVDGKFSFIKYWYIFMKKVFLYGIFRLKYLFIKNN